MIAALFDLDGTLYTGHIFRGILQHHRTHRTQRFYLYASMAAQMSLVPAWRLHLASEEDMRSLWLRIMAWTVRGWTVEEANRAFAWIAREYVLPRVRSDVMARLRQHQKSGHRAALVSGTFAPLLAEIGRQLGIEDTVGTPLIVRGGRYTGACESPVCQGEGKWLRVREHLNTDNIHWEESYAYADSYVDLSLLAEVGHAVAVYPDSQLASHAQERGWEILGEQEATPS